MSATLRMLIRALPSARLRQAIANRIPAGLLGPVGAWTRLRATRLEVRIEDTRDVIQRQLWFTGEYEPTTTRIVRALGDRSGATFVDVGANLGYFTLLAARAVDPSGHVLAVEADPGNVRLLRANLERNRVDAVEVVDHAAGAEAGLLRFDSSERTGQSGWSGFAADGDVEVAVETLDAMLGARGIERVDVLKVDVEGGEPLVLRGAERALARLADLGGIVVVEVNRERLARLGFAEQDVLEPLHLGRALSVERIGRGDTHDVVVRY